MVNPEILKRKDPELSNLERGQKEVGGGGMREGEEEMEKSLDRSVLRQFFPLFLL